MSAKTVSFRIDNNIKNMAKPILEAHGMSVSELCQVTLEYVAATGKIPVKKVSMSEENQELIKVARERLAETGTIAVNLENL